MDEHAARKILEGGGGAAGAVVRTVLAPAAWLYALAMRLRRAAYARGWLAAARASVPVISIGNITAGGSGKTPTTAMTVDILRQHGRRPAILLRGWRATADGISDEAQLYADLCPGVPVYVGADRAASAVRAAADGADVIVLDDGMQHLRLARDVDIVLIDATSPWGGGRTFPAGLLREPPGALAAAGIILITRADQCAPADLESITTRVRSLAPRAAVFTARHAPTALVDTKGAQHPLDALRGASVAAAAAIARPEAFAATLAALGADVRQHAWWRDHGTADPAAPGRALAAARAAGLPLLTTQKDAARGIWPPADDIWVLCVRQMPDDPEGFCKNLLAFCPPCGHN